MQTQLNISALQLPLFWEDPLQNRIFIEKHLKEIKDNTDVVLLPEMFTSGFTMNANKVAETEGGPTLKWMHYWAEKKDILIGGSLVIQEEGKLYNRFVMVGANGIIARYDKRHRFTLAGEDLTYSKGSNSGLFEYKGWKICLRICYDLRFPVWNRNTTDYDLLLFVANWPVARITAWDTLLQARAIENVCYVVGVNRIGLDANNLMYPGHSAIYNPLGKRLSEEFSSNETSVRAQVDYLELQALRKQLRFLEDRDNFELY